MAIRAGIPLPRHLWAGRRAGVEASCTQQNRVATERKRQERIAQRDADIAAMRETHAARIAAREDSDERARALRESAMQRAAADSQRQRDELSVARAVAVRRMADAAAERRAIKTDERAAAQQRAAQARAERDVQKAEQQQRERDFRDRFPGA